eukprot:TRINITY_DN14803_c0_g1_i1.p1 TRINITY_DN14803_c0_g1~~TRINITY_DN14803_c0_g1_i1.p1  ORF type:complete len:874 (+),score=251.25 TRINITY_DN14803_c0_g1_i1:225-2846(+)
MAGTSSFWTQFKALVYKNTLLLVRRRRSTVIMLLAPVMVMILLIIMQVLVNSNRMNEELFKEEKHQSPDDIDDIPRCSEFWEDYCYTFVYSPKNNKKVDKLVEKIRDANDIPSKEVRSFESPEKINKFIYNHPNTTQASYLFDTHKDGSITYTIQTNQTDYRWHGVRIRNIDRIAVPMQASADKYLLRYASDNNDFKYDVATANYPHPEVVQFNVIADAGPIFFLGGYMFVFVVALTSIVLEKESHVREALLTINMGMTAYWCSFLLEHAFLMCYTTAVYIILGLLFQFSFFLKNLFLLYLILFVLFSFSLITLCYLTSVFVSRQSQAALVGFMVFIGAFIFTILGAILFGSSINNGIQFLFGLFSPALFAIGLINLASATELDHDDGLTWSSRNSTADSDLWNWDSICIMLVVDTILYMLLAVYLREVVANEYGSRRSIFFCFKPSFWRTTTAKAMNKEKSRVMEKEMVDIRRDNTVADRDAFLKGPEADVREEEATSRQLYKSRKNGEGDGDGVSLLCAGLSKTFTTYHAMTALCCYCCSAKRKESGERKYRWRTQKHAVDDMWMHVAEKSVFCLLGPNGAGKTTLLRMLTGLVPPSSGHSYILGKSVTTEIAAVRQSIGVCPQFDVQWDELTGEEHLYIYSAIKGVPKDEIESEVDRRLEEVTLTSARTRHAGAYSGGMRRRLSVAMAMVGDPLVVFLDEPTTGMDPISRRQVWEIIETAKRDKMVFLTTHSMEEAERLSDSIAILSHGKLRTIGSSLQLKKTHGTGYRLTVNCESDAMDGIRQFFSDNLNDATLESEPVGGFLVFNVPSNQTDALPEFLQLLEKEGDDLGILDVHVSLSSMEEVFRRVAVNNDYDNMAVEDASSLEEDA